MRNSILNEGEVQALKASVSETVLQLLQNYRHGKAPPFLKVTVEGKLQYPTEVEILQRMYDGDPAYSSPKAESKTLTFRILEWRRPAPQGIIFAAQSEDFPDLVIWQDGVDRQVPLPAPEK